MKREANVSGTLFDILPYCAKGKPLRLKEFIAPYIYDTFIGVWSMFPYHDQVPLYFSKHIYVEFLLGMHHDYMSTPSTFYGSSMGHSYDHIGAYRDPFFVPPPMRLVPILSQSIVFSKDIVDPSHLKIEVRDVIENTMHNALRNYSFVVCR